MHSPFASPTRPEGGLRDSRSCGVSALPQQTLGVHDERVPFGGRSRRRPRPETTTTATGAAAQLQADERVQDRLVAFAGRRLFGFRVTLVSLTLYFGEQGDAPNSHTMWLYADQVGFAGPDGGCFRDDQRIARSSEAAALSLHRLLGREVREVTLDGGRLSLTFSHGSELSVDPRPDSQAWAVVLEIGEVIECDPGGMVRARVP